MNDKNRKSGCVAWRIISIVSVIFLLSQIIAALVGPPRCVIRWLEMPEIAPRETPRNIVVLGGGGIPSGSSLLRTYYAAQYGAGLPETTFVVSLPTDGNPDTSSVGRMRDELVLRGVPPAQIRMEYHGLNTYEQAVDIQKILGADALSESLLVVTSGYHMRRAVDCFRKLGYTKVSGLLASEVGEEADSGPWSWLRYGIWGHLDREILILRELTALAAYKIENRI